MKRLMIDMDNCITDAYFMETVNDFLHTDYKMKDQTMFHLQKLVPEDQRQDYWKYMLEHTFYGDCPLLENAYEVLKELNEKYELYIVTTYYYKDSNPDISGKVLKDKYEYLQNKLPFISPKQYIFIDDKTLIHWDIAIDDRTNNLKSADQKILMNAWHNQEFTKEQLEEQGIVRVSGWSEILEILK